MDRNRSKRHKANKSRRAFLDKLIDDDLLTQTAWKGSAEKYGKRIAVFSNMSEFFKGTDSIPAAAKIFIDVNLHSHPSGTQAADLITSKGFSKVKFTTGMRHIRYSAERFNLTQAQGKELSMAQRLLFILSCFLAVNPLLGEQNPANPAAERAERIAVDEGDREAGKLFLSALALSSQYQTLRENLIAQFRAEAERAHSENNGSVESTGQIGTLGGLALALSGLGLESSGRGRVGTRMTGTGIVVALAGLTTVLAYTSSFRSTGEALAAEQLEVLRRGIDTSVRPFADRLGHQLNWNEARKSRFIEGAINQIITRLSAMALAGRTSANVSFVFRYVQPTGDIDVIDILEERDLASRDQIAALRAIREAIRVAQANEEESNRLIESNQNAQHQPQQSITVTATQRLQNSEYVLRRIELIFSNPALQRDAESRAAASELADQARRSLAAIRRWSDLARRLRALPERPVQVHAPL